MLQFDCYISDFFMYEILIQLFSFMAFSLSHFSVFSFYILSLISCFQYVHHFSFVLLFLYIFLIHNILCLCLMYLGNLLLLQVSKCFHKPFYKVIFFQLFSTICIFFCHVQYIIKLKNKCNHFLLQSNMHPKAITNVIMAKKVNHHNKI